MRRLALAIALLLVVGVAHAAEWDTIRPGESAQAAVRTQFGQPTKVTSQKVEGYDTAQWLYEGAQAPHGMTKLTIDFGILTPQGYRADVVRVMFMQVKPGIFNRQTVLAGWGEPQGVSTAEGVPSMFYQSGLIVTFDKDGWNVTTMTFTPPQKPPDASGPPRR